MKVLNTKFNGLKTIEGIKFDDSRGYFREIFSEKLFKKKKKLFFGACQNQKKMFLEECIFKRKKLKQKLYRS